MSEFLEQELSPSFRESIYRRNFIYFLIDNILFSTAIGIIGSTTVIPDFVRHLTDSEILIGLSGSVFTIGFTLPQLFIARYIVRHERKKWWFVGPNIPVRFVILIFAFITVWLGKDHLELILLAFFICYSIAALGDGLVGVPWADLTGSSLDNRWRARMLGAATAITGVIMLLIAPLIAYVLGDNGPAFPNNYAIVFGLSGIVFALSIIPGLFFHELPGGKAVDELPPLSEFLPQLGTVLCDDASFLAYIVSRMFANLFMMALPFYIGYATVDLNLSSDVAVPVLLAMQTVGSVVGSIAYTWLGSRSNLLVIRLALGAEAVLPICALLAQSFGPTPLYFGFLMSGIATISLFYGYLNWIVGYADPDQRPLYVGLSNTVTAVISLIAPFIGGIIAGKLGHRPLFLISLAMVLSALYVALRFIHDTKIEEIPTVETSSGNI